jgi:hypothetical protein
MYSGIYLGPLTTTCISFFRHHAKDSDQSEQLKFNFGGEERSLTDLILAAATALQNQQKFVEIGSVKVTPNYIWVMINFATREGWFCDALDSHGQDHDFDANEPTPGAHWQEARRLRRCARDEAATAKRLREPGSGVTNLALAHVFDRKAARFSREAARVARALT